MLSAKNIHTYTHLKFLLYWIYFILHMLTEMYILCYFIFLVILVATADNSWL